MQISRKLNNMPLGLAVAVLFNWAVENFTTVEVTNEVAMSMAAIVMAVFGYFVHEARPE